jgi:hypothetical protein
MKSRLALSSYEAQTADPMSMSKTVRVLHRRERWTGDHLAEPEVGSPRLSSTPLSDPAGILRRMPSQAISPALLELLDLLSSPFLLIDDSPAGESEREMLLTEAA